jgi:putative transposase
MKRQRHSEEQIIAILKEREAGIKAATSAAKHWISDATPISMKLGGGLIGIRDSGIGPACL